MTDELAAAMLDELKAIRAAPEGPRQDRLLTASGVARWLSVGKDWVYARSEELGAIRSTAA